MANLFGIAVSGLYVAQQNLTTTSHNITNANTDGYNRQRVDQEARTPIRLGDNYVGTGVVVTDVNRYYSEALVNSLRDTSSEYEKLNAYQEMTSRLDGILADEAAGLSPAMLKFFDSVQDLSNDPSSISARQVVISSGESLAGTMKFIDDRMNDMYQDIDRDLEAEVSEANELAQTVADLNKQITVVGNLPGSYPNDLLDRRDLAISELAQKFDVTTALQEDGSINVFIGTGQVLVYGATANTLSTQPNPFDNSRKELAITTGYGGASIQITTFLDGGRIGGLLEFRSEVLDEARNELGRVAVVLADQMNQQHNKGYDMDNTLGMDMFNVAAPQVNNSINNATLFYDATDVTIADTTQLTGSDYRIDFDGANYSITRMLDSQVLATNATGAFTVDGLTINAPTTAGTVPGETTVISPTVDGANLFEMLITQPKDIAASAPMVATAANANTGTGIIELEPIPDGFDAAGEYTADFATTVTITFDDPPNTFDLVDPVSGTNLNNIPFTPGQQLPYVGPPSYDPGFRINLTGTPAAGDVFTIEPNIDGVGDNRNALLMGEVETSNFILGQESLQDAYSQLVSDVGAVTQRTNVNLEAQIAMRDNAREVKDRLSGVNLDEEAANLLKYEQAYQASARLIQTADSMFQTILGMLG
ncbi:MAG: flagellar hook-associated protein FlgK [Gammaproteobacteria bacterium]|nr:MAG: flagellar hook-associated protein FlgK [Gammaproteobacteria bacterium]